MEIRLAEEHEAERIAKELWKLLANEMEKISEYNQLKDNLDIQEVVEHKKSYIQEENKFILIEEEFKGFVSFKIKDSAPCFNRGQKLKISELFVKEKYRRKGLASKLMEEAMNYSEDCSTVELNVNVRNEKAKEFYKKHGFNEERIRMIKNE